MENIAQISMMICCLSISVFGIVHLFWPKIFKWNEIGRGLPEVFMDSISTINFFMSVELIILGASGLISAIAFWQNSELMLVINWVISILLVIRIIRELVVPIRIPNIKIRVGFFSLFILVLLLSVFPLMENMVKVA